MMFRNIFSTHLTQRSLRKYFSSVIASALLVASCSLNSHAAAPNLVVNGDFSTGDLSGWSIANLTPDHTAISYDGVEGVPAGSAYFDRAPNGPVFFGDNKDHLYQFIAVEVGEYYTFDADWKGDLYGDVKNWAEARLAFLPTDTPPVDGSFFIGAWQQYKKQSDASGVHNPANAPIDPPEAGWDWESIHVAPKNAPANNLFLATDPWMVISFNIGGRTPLSAINPGDLWLNVDNVTVTKAPEPSSVVMLVLGCLATVGTARRSRK